MRNLESKYTDAFRRELKRLGCYELKLSDRFTRGIPDLIVVTPRGVVMVEAKVFQWSGPTHTWKQLGLSGLQDERLRSMCTVCRHSAWCVTFHPADGVPSIWTPVSPESNLVETYRMVAHGWSVFGKLMEGAT